jgi:hypothetical protein
MCMYACVCMHVYVCMCMYACVCMHVQGSVLPRRFAHFPKNIYIHTYFNTNKNQSSKKKFKKKIRYILQYAEKKKSRMFYETGVWYGETINGLKGVCVCVCVCVCVVDREKQTGFSSKPKP